MNMGQKLATDFQKNSNFAIWLVHKNYMQHVILSCLVRRKLNHVRLRLQKLKKLGSYATGLYLRHSMGYSPVFCLDIF